jgi:DNA-binding NtrC family response regulator
MARILIVDDEAHMRRIVAVNLAGAGHEVTEARDVDEGRRRILAEDFQAVFVDQKMPGGEGLDIVASARQADPTLSVVMLTAMATVELAVEAMRRGAFDFLTKPFAPDVLLSVAQRACERTALLRENRRLKQEVEELEGGGDIYGSSAAIAALRTTIARVAPTHATVLITGETGTGKELVARAIHKNSPRADKPFVAVNCAAFTESLLESELFGHEKGAFTGAERSRQGLFEAANEGTLFLDEAGEMSLTAQAKLLRVLTDGKITRVGSTQPRPVSVRVLVATHRDLLAMSRDGHFRQDLYYRLAVVPIAIPPLRERTDDIPILCEVLSEQVARTLKVPRRRILPEALRNLKSYPFPGNVRELRNVIERAYILSSGETLGPECFAVQGAGASAGLPFRCLNCPQLKETPEGFDVAQFLEDVEKTVIVNALAAAGGTQAEAARKLGLSRSVLSYKIAKYGVRNY